MQQDGSDWDGRDHLGQIVSPGTYLIHRGYEFQTGVTSSGIAPVVVELVHMIRLIFVILFSVPLISQVFSEYSYVGVQGSTMTGSVISHTSSESGIFQNPASISDLMVMLL